MRRATKQRRKEASPFSEAMQVRQEAGSDDKYSANKYSGGPDYDDRMAGVPSMHPHRGVQHQHQHQQNNQSNQWDIGSHDFQTNALGGGKHKQANNSLYFPSPDPSLHPHVPYSMYKLLMKGNGNAGSFPHPHAHQDMGMGKHHSSTGSDLEVADRHPHSRSASSASSRHGHIPVQEQQGLRQQGLLPQQHGLDAEHVSNFDPEPVLDDMHAFASLQLPFSIGESIGAPVNGGNANANAHSGRPHVVAGGDQTMAAAVPDAGYDSVRNEHGVSFFAQSNMGDMDLLHPGHPRHRDHKLFMEFVRENMVLKEMLRSTMAQLYRQTTLLTDVAQKISEKNSKDEESKSRYWTEEEHQRFLDAMNIYGPKDVKNIAKFVGSRNATQVRTHAQKFSMKMSRQQKSGNKGGKQTGWHGTSGQDGGDRNGNESGSGSGSVNEGDGSEAWSDQASSWCLSDAIGSSSGHSQMAGNAARESDSKSNSSSGSSSSSTAKPASSSASSRETKQGSTKRARASSSSETPPPTNSSQSSDAVSGGGSSGGCGSDASPAPSY